MKTNVLLNEEEILFLLLLDLLQHQAKEHRIQEFFTKPLEKDNPFPAYNISTPYPHK